MKPFPGVVSAALAVALLSPGCFRAQYRVETLHIPEARDETELMALAELLHANNRYLDDESQMILLITPLPDLPGLRVRYNPMVTALKNLEHRVAAAGFTANEIPGDPETRAAFRAGRSQPNP